MKAHESAGFLEAADIDDCLDKIINQPNIDDTALDAIKSRIENSNVLSAQDRIYLLELEEIARYLQK